MGPPTEIAFSPVLGRVLFGLSALHSIGLVPMLGSIGEMNTMGEWMDQGAVGTKFLFGFLLLVATVAAGFFAIGKVRNRDATGRVVLLGFAVASLLSSWLVFGSGGAGSLGLGAAGVVVTVLVTWGAILGPLWIGRVAADWFQTKEIQLVSLNNG